ncbi:6-phospho-3-hexuloisomerase [Salinicoccus hispanicus]|uniref:SIS domain-containing protein n=1 Tax=Salinicoccus hispanicus TaxID=157225 RepID=A0A6N8U519_9STAP|nr:6-phospho-3-hexuloisomerase [Salinicoccus hispanicus]MXQ51381.1 SIS domain-containing protein [Salinicoccus hispanicus]
MNYELGNIFNQISKEVSEVCTRTDDTMAARFADCIARAEKVFVYGNGRSGLTGKMFGMRLMHSGYDVYIVGETNTPSFSAKDLLIVISGSGKSETINNMVYKVQEIGGTSALVTASEDQSVSEKFGCTLHLHASTKHNDIPTIQPLGNQFDQSLHLVMDAIVIYLNQKNNKTNEALKKMHFNLE